MRTPGNARAAQGYSAAHCGSPRIRSRADLVDAIHAVANGDEAAFASVYAATAAKLFGTIVRIVSRREVAEDVLQEVYLRIWRHAHTFDPHSGSPITWMVTIARRCALDEVRRKDVVLSIEEVSEVVSLVSKDDPIAGDEENTSRERDLAQALERLSRDKRSILVQAYYYGLTREEIAKRTGRPISTVKTWLRRALAELRIYLTEQEFAMPGGLCCFAAAAPSSGLHPVRHGPLDWADPGSVQRQKDDDAMP